MINLLQVELKKIFKRKSIYIIWILMLIFCILNNVLYYKDYDKDGNYKYLEHDDLELEWSNLEEELLKYNSDNPKEVTMYITIKTKLDLLKLKKNFPYTSWQYKKINEYLYDVIYQKYYYQYVDNNITESIKYQERYNQIVNEFNKNNYLYFLNMEIQDCIYNQSFLEEMLKIEIDEKNIQKLELQKEENEFKFTILNYRLKYNIPEDNGYLNDALEAYQENYKTVRYYDEFGEKKKYQDKLFYQEALSEMKISEYIIEHRQNINKQNNLNYQLRTIVEDYEIFIVILIFIVCSAIICDEFKDGTIKLLLIKPYSRGKILLSKYFASTLVIAITILLLVIMQFIIGGIIFGVDSLKLPVVVYNFNNSKIIEYSIFKYMLIRIGAKIPFLLILIVITFFLGVVTSNTITSISMPLILYMFNPTIIYLTKQYKIEFMKYLININWNLQDYLFGYLSEISFIDLNFSVMLLLIYFIFIIMFTFIIFKRKNIKNI